MINLKCNQYFPEGMIVVSQDLYKKFIEKLKFTSKCVFINKNLPQNIAIVSSDVFKQLTKEKKKCKLIE